MTTLQESIEQALTILRDIHPGNMTPMAEEAWNSAIAILDDVLDGRRSDQPVAWIRKDGTHVDLHEHPGYNPLYVITEE